MVSTCRNIFMMNMMTMMMIMMLMMTNYIFYLVCAAMHHPSNGPRLHLQETDQVVLHILFMIMIMMKGVPENCMFWNFCPKRGGGFHLQILFWLAFIVIVWLVWWLWHSCLKWPLEEIYNLVFEHLTYSAILVPNWNT